MMRLAMSPAASALLRALVARAEVEPDRILLSMVESVDWQSLTFTGERHKLNLRIIGADSDRVADRICAGLGEAEIRVPGAILADIARVGEAATQPDGSTDLMIEALTVADD
ncbi:MAG TPA: hypothetical protein VIL42_09970 [Sphingomicrobium sp.]|jgi:hypothetical protein